jgi:hypothetical protein
MLKRTYQEVKAIHHHTEKRIALSPVSEEISATKKIGRREAEQFPNKEGKGRQTC